MVDVVKKVSEEVFIPLTVGGGIRSVSDVRSMLEAGADKVSINTAAIDDPSIVKKASQFFGSQCIVVAVDAKRVEPGSPKDAPVDEAVQDVALDGDSRWQVYVHGGRTPTGIDALKWAKRAAELGAGELLVTSMDTDGQLTGYDLELLRAISDSVTIPIIASGGAGKPDHLLQAIEKGRADAVLAASIFHFGTHPIGEVKDYLREHGVLVRPDPEI
jgi:cyclase